MSTVSASAEGRSVTYGDVLKKKPLQLPIPVRELDTLETLTCGFYQSSVDCEHGGVYTHGGFGSRVALTIRWKGKTFSIDSLELLAAVVSSFDPKDAKAILDADLGGEGRAKDAAERLGAKKKRYSGSTKER